MATRIKKPMNNPEQLGLKGMLYQDMKSDIKPIHDMPICFEGIEYLTDYIIENIDGHDLDMCLNIIENLFFHQKKDVIAYCIGRLYTIFNDQQIRKIMIEKLRELRSIEDDTTQEYVNESMEIIAGEVNSIEIFKLECNFFNNISQKFAIYLNIAFKKIFQKFDYKFVTRVKKSQIISKLDYMTIYMGNIMNFIEYEIELDTNCEHPNNLNEHFNDTIMELEKVESGERNLNNLVDIYALTFRENGHLNHLISILNDENPEIRIMAADGLLYVLKVLIQFNDHIPYEGTISELLNSVKILPKIPRSLKSRISIKDIQNKTILNSN